VDPSLAAALRALFHRGKAAWPQIALDEPAFAAQAMRQRSTPWEAAEIELLNAADLYLACACAKGVPAAHAAFERGPLASPSLAAAVRRIGSRTDFLDEVQQSLREKLLLGRDGSPPRIADYSGRWPLATWLRTIAVRAAVDLRRTGGKANEGPAGDEELAERVGEGDGTDLRYLKRRYGAAFQEALNAAFSALDAEETNLLKLQFVDGLRTSEIAALFGVDRSTVKRRLADCRDRILEQTKQRLQAKLGLSPAEFESLAGLVQSELKVSLARLLNR
jgi:RNA polymerase sigma-70 factor (ECF subfamily)